MAQFRLWEVERQEALRLCLWLGKGILWLLGRIHKKLWLAKSHKDIAKFDLYFQDTLEGLYNQDFL